MTLLFFYHNPVSWFRLIQDWLIKYTHAVGEYLTIFTTSILCFRSRFLRYSWSMRQPITTPLNYEKYHQFKTYTALLYLKISSDWRKRISMNQWSLVIQISMIYLVIHDNLGWIETRSQQNINNLHFSFLNSIKIENPNLNVSREIITRKKTPLV